MANSTEPMDPLLNFQNGSKECWVDDKLHRIDGPAVEFADGRKEWWVNGIKIDIEKIIATYDLNPDWTQWSDSEKILVRLAV